MATVQKSSSRSFSDNGCTTKSHDSQNKVVWFVFFKSYLIVVKASRQKSNTNNNIVTPPATVSPSTAHQRRSTKH